jgi:transposase
MRQHHVAGEKAFVDYSGKRIGIADPLSGEIREAEIFIGVLGASNLTYAEATWTQQLPDWTGAHVRMFRFFGGAPKLLVDAEHFGGSLDADALLQFAKVDRMGHGKPLSLPEQIV